MDVARIRIAPTIFALTLAIAGLLHADAQQPPATVVLADLVESLGDDSFHSRHAAACSLLEVATPSNPGSQVNAALIDSLRSGLQHPLLEVRIACMRLLQSVEQAIFDNSVEQLLNPHVDPASIEMVGWKRFSEMAGNDSAARSLFARVATNYSGLLREIELRSGGEEGNSNPARLGQLDPYRIASENATAWALLLSCDAPGVQHGVANLSPRITMSLSNSTLGPRIKSQNDSIVIGRLISHWIGTHGTSSSARERLMIAMRYGCHPSANELCQEVFSDSNALPSCQVTAMLSASVLGREDLESILIERLHDDRTSHVWQLIASRKTKIRTQVRDVALALLLHQHGIDPRTVGYDELQADALLVFRDHSLGFADETSRQAAYAQAARVLGDVGQLLRQ